VPIIGDEQIVGGADGVEPGAEALEKLIAMLKNNRGRYEDPLSWRLNLQNVANRNKDAAEGKGVSMKDVDSDWVEVDDGYVSAKELAAETEEILKRLSGGGK